MKTWLSFPNSIRKLGVELLNQQMWLFGCDIRRHEGNLLLRYGFESFHPPASMEGSTCYCKCLGNHEWLMLWGFGLYFQCGNDFGLFLKRYEFMPRLMTFPACVWNMEQMPSSYVPQCETECEQSKLLMAKACEWIAEYETWILHTAGLAYRRECLDGWSLKTVREPQEIANAWNQISIASKGLHVRQRD